MSERWLRWWWWQRSTPLPPCKLYPVYYLQFTILSTMQELKGFLKQKATKWSYTYIVCVSYVKDPSVLTLFLCHRQQTPLILIFSYMTCIYTSRKNKKGRKMAIKSPNNVNTSFFKLETRKSVKKSHAMTSE